MSRRSSIFIKLVQSSLRRFKKRSLDTRNTDKEVYFLFSNSFKYVKNMYLLEEIFTAGNNVMGHLQGAFNLNQAKNELDRLDKELRVLTFPYISHQIASGFIYSIRALYHYKNSEFNLSCSYLRKAISSYNRLVKCRYYHFFWLKVNSEMNLSKVYERLGMTNHAKRQVLQTIKDLSVFISHHGKIYTSQFKKLVINNFCVRTVFLIIDPAIYFDITFFDRLSFSLNNTSSSYLKDLRHWAECHAAYLTKHVAFARLARRLLLSDSNFHFFRLMCAIDLLNSDLIERNEELAMLSIVDEAVSCLRDENQSQRIRFLYVTREFK